nr:uncharacterized protein LOC126056176 [Helicoverpa armigera]
MEISRSAANFPECEIYKKKKVEIEVNQEQALEMFQGLDAVCPLFEEKVHNYKLMKHVSLCTNDLLRCRWKSMVRNIEGWKKQPYQFLHLNDFHFNNYAVQYNPAETVANWPTYRVHLKCGPGVDAYGQIPIPSDLKTYRA